MTDATHPTGWASAPRMPCDDGVCPVATLRSRLAEVEKERDAIPDISPALRVAVQQLTEAEQERDDHLAAHTRQAADHDARVREMARVQAERMDRMRASLAEVTAERDAALRDLADVHADFQRIAMECRDAQADLARAQDELAAERGERGREGWYFSDGEWCKGDGGPDSLTASRDPCPMSDDEESDWPWLPTTWTVVRLVYLDLSPEPKTRLDEVGTYPTALEAMEAADRAAGAPDAP